MIPHGTISLEPGSSAPLKAVDWTLLAVRAAAATIFMAHGAQKLFGAFGGPGLEAVVENMGPLGYFVAGGEFFGGLGILIGVLPRFSALSIIAIMVGAIATVHGKNGFFLNKGGFEYNLALIALLLPILILGPGRIAISEHVSLWRPKQRVQSKTAAQS